MGDSFTKLYDDVMSRSDLTLSEKVVLCYLWRERTKQMKHRPLPRVKEETIAAALKLSISKVKEAVAKLKSKGDIEVTYTPSKTNAYKLEKSRGTEKVGTFSGPTTKKKKVQNLAPVGPESGSTLVQNLAPVGPENDPIVKETTFGTKESPQGDSGGRGAADAASPPPVRCFPGEESSATEASLHENETAAKMEDAPVFDLPAVWELWFSRVFPDSVLAPWDVKAVNTVIELIEMYGDPALIAKGMESFIRHFRSRYEWLNTDKIPTVRLLRQFHAEIIPTAVSDLETLEACLAADAEYEATSDHVVATTTTTSSN